MILVNLVEFQVQKIVLFKLKEEIFCILTKIDVKGKIKLVQCFPVMSLFMGMKIIVCKYLVTNNLND